MPKVLVEKPKKVRPIPESVRHARACGDTATLRHLGRIGGVRSAERGVERLLIAKIHTEEAEALANELLAAEYARMVRADAYAHAMSNRIGWDDSFS